MSNKKVQNEREKIMKLLEESLPSGSGFDYDFKSYLEDTVSEHLSEKEDAFHRCEKNLLELHGKCSR